MTEAELIAAMGYNTKPTFFDLAARPDLIDDERSTYALLAIVVAIDRLTAEVKALREAQETALRLAQGTLLRGEEGERA